jgi:hypothetical protein
VKPEGVVQVTQGGNLLVVTEPRNNVDNVKITDGSGRITELVNTNGDTFSLSGISPGVYNLDVIVNLPSSDNRAAYETILVILQPGQPPQEPTQIIQKVEVVTDVLVTFDDYDDDDGCSDKPGSAGMSYPMDKRTECEKKDYDNCEKKGFKTSGKFCDNIYELFNDDDCFGYANQKECDEGTLPKDCEPGFVKHDGKCKPICGEGGYKTGELCLDDGDEITCDGPAVPKGDKCVMPDQPVEGEPIIFPDTGVEYPIESNPVEQEPVVNEKPVEEEEVEESETEEVEEEESNEGSDGGVN